MSLGDNLQITFIEISWLPTIFFHALLDVLTFFSRYDFDKLLNIISSTNFTFLMMHAYIISINNQSNIYSI